ncbi:MAG: hypothetical protein Q7U37_09480 [Gallionella sp.]|nr:hypothetical protein [Gallionella sp.]
MEEMREDMVEAFCVDCRQRMQCVADIVQTGMPLSRTQLDQLHQEFDTLFGGARAVHLPEMERFLRSMAIYARYLRNRLRDGQTIDQSCWQDLRAGIAVLRRCGDEMCLEACNDDRDAKLLAIESRINKGDAR